VVVGSGSGSSSSGSSGTVVCTCETSKMHKFAATPFIC
jgi:hypothetical protein